MADEIRAANSDVLVQIVPCDLGRPAGVATLCAAAQRRDVTLAVASSLHPALSLSLPLTLTLAVTLTLTSALASALGAERRRL